jgi:hypothetical protein
MKEHHEIGGESIDDRAGAYLRLGDMVVAIARRHHGIGNACTLAPDNGPNA